MNDEASAVNLHPDHIADLQRSGLTGKVLSELAIADVRPHDITVQGVRSAYRIPFFDIDGTQTGFERQRLFPAVKTSDGHTQKYFQLNGTDPHPYFPPLMKWRPIAHTPDEPLIIVEGEKKAASACRLGIDRKSVV